MRLQRVSEGGVLHKFCNFNDFVWVSKGEKKIPGSEDPGYNIFEGELL
jgi:hypothetical protein